MDDRRSSAESTGRGYVSIEMPVYDGESSTGSSSRGTVSKRPEKKLVLFAMVLVFLQRMSIGIGALGFVWATTVVLVSLANISNKTDFYFITIILLMETARFFSLSQDLERKLESPWTISGALIKAAGKSDDDDKADDKDEEDTQLLLPDDDADADDDDLFFLSKNISKLLYCLQLLSVLSCITLSVVRVIQLSLGDLKEVSLGSGYTNMRPAVYVFYVLAFAQAFLSLSEKAYWEWTITYRRLLEEVKRDCKLGMIPITSFFYHAYSERVDGKIFDGLSQQLDLFSFASNFLNTSSRHQQLIGIRILHKFSTCDRYSSDALRNIGTSMPVMEKLLYMLSWKGSKEAEIRQKAAKIVVKLAGKRWNSFRLSGFPGALENIFSLIDRANPIELQSLGFTIFKKLSHDCINCVDIAASRSLMMTIIATFDEPVFHDHSAKILNNCCKYASCNFLNKAFGGKSRGVTSVAILTLKMLMKSKAKEKPPQILVELARRQILVELARRLVTYMNDTEANEINTVIMEVGTQVPKVESLGDNQSGVAKLIFKLREILQENYKAIPGRPNMTPKEWDKVRETTISTVGLAIETMKSVEHAVTTLKKFRMVELLDLIRKATINIDCEEIHDLINSALRLLAVEGISSSDSEFRTRVVGRGRNNFLGFRNQTECGLPSLK